MKQVIREGDTLREYGGKVLAGHYLCFGKGIATKGDQVKCNKHGMTTIIGRQRFVKSGWTARRPPRTSLRLWLHAGSSFPDCGIAQ